MESPTNHAIVVTGAGGFIGGALVADLRRRGCTSIRAIDVKPFDQWYQRFDNVENLSLDLNLKQNCDVAVHGATEVYNLAANMGGMGFIEQNKALCMLSVLINTHMLQASLKHGVRRYFYSSSACVYNADKQKGFEAPSLKEEDAYPALAEDGYGWEKLFSERMCRHFREDFGLETRVARFHNVYGSWGTWYGGREKAPASPGRLINSSWGGTRIEPWISPAALEAEPLTRELFAKFKALPEPTEQEMKEYNEVLQLGDVVVTHYIAALGSD